MGYVSTLRETNRNHVSVVGGKGAQLGTLSHIDGVRVPDGFCVTTDAWRRIMAQTPSIDVMLDRLGCLDPDDRDAIRVSSAQIRDAIEATAIPSDVAAAIRTHLARLGEQTAYAVRSSATAEDLPGASFAGQQDSYLNVVGPAEILRHVGRCWASLFTERAVTYRMRNGFDHRRVQMAVIVQQMVSAHAAGVMFTADPVTSNRRVVSVEAILGLGEALVSGLANPDTYQVRDGRLVIKPITTAGQVPALTDEQILRLAQLGRLIESHFGCPQDIEWCRVDDDFSFVQTRPITTLFPVPATDDDQNHVYVSVGHQQMMTDPMKPLGLSVWQLTTPRPMAEAGGRLFVDVGPALASPRSRASVLDALGKSDPLITDALQSVLDRGDFIIEVPDPDADGKHDGETPAPIATDPAVVTELIEDSRSSLAALEQEIRTVSGPALFDFILTNIRGELKRLLFSPRSMQVIMAGMEARWWLNDRLQEWLDEKSVADILTQSVPHNITSEMGLALLDLADVIRPYPGVVVFLQDVENEDRGFLTELPALVGGRESRDAICGYLDTYGMRCAGEIDITRPRWREQPATLVPIILSNIKNFEPGAAKRRLEQGRREAEQKEQELVARLQVLPDGAQKADEVKQMIDRVRTFAGFREYPKYGMVCRYFVYKQALLREAERLVDARTLRDKEDIFYLRFEELHDVARTNRVDQQLIDQRKQAFESYAALTPPRVLTSDGEAITGQYRRTDLPAGALAGLAVSTGTIEGRARVITDMAQADVEAGDILVTPYTDPSWTPLFVTVAGLVTEVGGLMTHGAVIAREYGLPAVVGVENATGLILDGQRIRVHGTDGYVEILG